MCMHDAALRGQIRPASPSLLRAIPSRETATTADACSLSYTHSGPPSWALHLASRWIRYGHNDINGVGGYRLTGTFVVAQDAMLAVRYRGKKGAASRCYTLETARDPRQGLPDISLEGDKQRRMRTMLHSGHRE